MTCKRFGRTTPSVESGLLAAHAEPGAAYQSPQRSVWLIRAR